MCVNPPWFKPARFKDHQVGSSLHTWAGRLSSSVITQNQACVKFGIIDVGGKSISETMNHEVNYILATYKYE